MATLAPGQTKLPEQIRDVAPPNTEWVILPAGDAVYEFALAEQANVDPNANLAAIKIPDKFRYPCTGADQCRFTIPRDARKPSAHVGVPRVFFRSGGRI